MSQKDITEKMLFTYNDVFADVVNALLFKGEQVIAEEELVDQAPRAAYKTDGVIRDIERDVAKRWLKNNIRIACIGIENQTEPDQDMAIRVFSYDSAEYRAQLSTETLKHVEAVLQLLSVMTQDTRFEDVLKQEKGSEGVFIICARCLIESRQSAWKKVRKKVKSKVQYGYTGKK